MPDAEKTLVVHDTLFFVLVDKDECLLGPDNKTIFLSPDVNWAKAHELELNEKYPHHNATVTPAWITLDKRVQIVEMEEPDEPTSITETG